MNSVVIQRQHPNPYVPANGWLEGTLPIQFAPPATMADPAPFTPDHLMQVAARVRELAASEGEWVHTIYPGFHIPWDHVVDRDLVLISIADLWFKKVSAGCDKYPYVDVRHEVAAYAANHPAKSRFMDYAAKTSTLGGKWPDYIGHKILLDRTRKLAAGGLIILDQTQTDGDGKMRYLAGIAKLGLVRLAHLRQRLANFPDWVPSPLIP
jgi:hypothetical protein